MCNPLAPTNCSVMPAQAGTHANILEAPSAPQSPGVDPRLRGDDLGERRAVDAHRDVRWLTSPIDELEPVLGGRCPEPVPEALRQTTCHRKLIGWPVVDLPQMDGDMGDQGGGCIPGLECAGVEVYGYALGQGVADMGPADAQQRAP